MARIDNRQPAIENRRDMNRISVEELQVISKYVYDVSGIVIDEKKAYLVETRLRGVAQELGCSSYGELHTKAVADKTTSVKEKIIDAISTNETLFFRDKVPFELLRHKIIPELIDRRLASAGGALPIPIRIWSAACSTGQEVYSIAIVLKELLPDPRRYQINLLGTDISDKAVKQASYGAYNKFEIERGLSEDTLRKYFVCRDDCWKIKDEIRAIAQFKKLNLLSSFQVLGKFDIIFCRNVAIYFSPEDRKNLFDRLADALDAGGSLIIGSTESLTGVSTRFEPKRHLRSIFYQVKS
jgi:chemotaxis protein methyltransferase CheR